MRTWIKERAMAMTMSWMTMWSMKGMWTEAVCFVVEDGCDDDDDGQWLGCSSSCELAWPCRSSSSESWDDSVAGIYRLEFDDLARRNWNQRSDSH
jgi:hypothetical protein